MKKPSNMTMNHFWAASFFIGVLFVCVIGSALLMHVILPYADREAVFLMQIFVGIGVLIGWIVRGVWRSSRDYTVNSMGPMALKAYIGELQQVYENKYGAKNDGK